MKRSIGVLATGVAIHILGANASNVVAQSTVATGFVDEVVISGLSNPTAVRFSPDGRVFVAEKSGMIKVFDQSLRIRPRRCSPISGPTCTTTGIGACSDWRSTRISGPPLRLRPYTFDGPIGGTAPTWGMPGVSSDGCPDPPAGTATAASSAAGCRA